MKYVRTKDGRIVEVKENMVVKVCDDATRLVYKEKPYICVLNGDDDILKEADTIDELCDEFVQEYPNAVGKGYLLTKNFNEFRKWHIFAFCANYGAIWIELPNGASRLEPVAKMNEEGKLELL